MTTNGGATTTTTATSSSLPLYSQYPISSHWELTLTNDETVSGEVYCTDPVAEVVVLHNDLKEVRVVSVGQIRESKQIKEADVDTASISSGFNTAHAKKALDEREKRSLKLAQESLKSVNPKVRSRSSFVRRDGAMPVLSSQACFRFRLFLSVICSFISLGLVVVDSHIHTYC